MIRHLPSRALLKWPIWPFLKRLIYTFTDMPPPWLRIEKHSFLVNSTINNFFFLVSIISAKIILCNKWAVQTHNYIQFTVINDKEKQIHEANSHIWEVETTVWHFCLKNDLKHWKGIDYYKLLQIHFLLNNCFRSTYSGSTKDNILLPPCGQARRTARNKYQNL